MSKFMAVLLASMVFLAGCTTVTEYRKSVTVEKDKDGNVVKTTILEEINQPYLKEKVATFKYLDK